MFGWYVTKCHDSGIIHNVRFEKLDNSQISATGNQNSDLIKKINNGNWSQ